MQLKLLPKDVLDEMVSACNLPKDEALATLAGISRPMLYTYQADVEMNKILLRAGVFSFANVLPKYMQNLKEGVDTNDYNAMKQSQSLVSKLLDMIQTESPSTHVHVENHLHLSDGDLQSKLEALKSKHKDK